MDLDLDPGYGAFVEQLIAMPWEEEEEEECGGAGQGEWV